MYDISGFSLEYVTIHTKEKFCYGGDMRNLVISFLLFLIISISTTVGLAKDKEGQIDFRKTRIARVSFLEGSASLQHQSTDQWDGAALNVPIFAGDLVHSTKDSRLELEIYGGFVRMSENTSLQLAEFSPNLYRFDLSAGLTTFSFGKDLPQTEIATPQVAVKLKKSGIYRINVQENGTTTVIVQEGEAELFTKTNSFKLKKGKEANFPNNSSNVTVSQIPNTDAWDNWNNERELLVSANSINGYLKPKPYLYGRSALNQYGQWLNVPSYGSVWRPSNVSAGWVPYSVGRWAYYRTTGWTWVSQEAWGWLPYHYGHWVFLTSYGWVWVPDDLDWYWSPALVAWYYGTWDGNSYICWHPSNNNWNGGSWGGNPKPLTTKEAAIENALNNPKTIKPGIVSLPVADFTNGNGIVSGKNINPEINITKTLNIKEVSLPKSPGLTPTVAPVGIQEIISRPLVTQTATNLDNGNSHHKYEPAKDTILNSNTNNYSNDQKNIAVSPIDSISPSNSGKNIALPSQSDNIITPSSPGISPSNPGRIK